MVETGVHVDPCQGCGPICCLHGLVGGAIQGVIIWFTLAFTGSLGIPVATMLHFGSCVSCQVREKLRVKYEMPEQANCCEDWCIHYICGGCAIIQEYEELRLRASPHA